MVQMNLFTKHKYSHRCRKQTYGHQKLKAGERTHWELGLTDPCSIYKADKQQGPAVWHRESYSASCNNLKWKII